MRIVFDIDDTIAKTALPWFDKSKEYCVAVGDSYNYLESKRWTGPFYYDVTKVLEYKDERDKAFYYKWMYDNFDFLALEPVLPLNFFEKLIAAGHEVAFITARTLEVRDVTYQWLKSIYSIRNPEVYFQKVYTHDIGADVLVDNSVFRCYQAYAAGVTPVLFTKEEVDNDYDLPVDKNKFTLIDSTKQLAAFLEKLAGGVQ